MKKEKILKQIDRLKSIAIAEGIDLSSEINKLRAMLELESDDFQKEKQMKEVWEIVQNSRKIERPKPQDFIKNFIEDFIELKGDRRFGNDNAVIGGIGYFDKYPVTVVGIQKGHTLNENIEYNFGSPHPEGYRKALRLSFQAEKFTRPILFFVDTPGAYPGIDSEERGMAEAIAENLYYLSDLKTPIISVITGEGGSGGALALGVSDILIMMQNAILSVISPEGCASILFKDSSKAAEASVSLKLTSFDLLNLGIVDKVIDEGPGLEVNPEIGYKNLSEQILTSLQYFTSLSSRELVEHRNQKIRKIGYYKDTTGYLKKGISNTRNFIYDLFKL
ncbi:MAG: acetyl-CoA carboxylase carboxyl transferase subunit alpha [Spirochaetes bacterium]|nr:acetyl-CoA carboxylase carboxyl transferase subunit alpha [Spirochaetota bacterium]NLJ04260.1 acetyl-CoA carboxylase carboxyl transferase subunit alpha [Exilispira sp.]HQO86129.1 acetyl-CoA carboxylase carboxyl transferase subunit alpha [Bacteroidia bacterium]MBP8990867.1 acetyl-CoA carboxylase carboxyl transferase subunit alpha [Spirochaetota bacterium]HNV43676.1 acetyl-CoA carboxylase carboxyl transferase subunit alpha [Exilispira sp.]